MQIQRQSDRCHAVAAYCANPARGAAYTTQRVKGARLESVLWLPPPGCGRGEPRAPLTNELVDSVAMWLGLIVALHHRSSILYQLC